MSIHSTDNAQSIFLSDQERLEGKYSLETLAKVLGALNQDGLVVLKNVIPVDTIDKINTWMCDDADRRIRDPNQKFNFGIKCKKPGNRISHTPRAWHHDADSEA